MRKPLLPRLPIAGLALALACCTAPEEPSPGPGEDPLFPGRWVEIPSEGVVRFAGQDLTFHFDFDSDSLRILDHQFTDAIACELLPDSTRRCSDHRWTNTFAGTWSLIGSALVLDFHFVGTTASPLTGNNLPVRSGRAEFKPSLAGNTLVLTRVGGEFITPKPEIRLEPTFRCGTPPFTQE